MKIDLKAFDGTLPYASELYGVYQPLLGWKSKRVTRRLMVGANAFRNRMPDAITRSIYPDVQLELNEGRDEFTLHVFRPGTETLKQRPVLA